MSTMKKEKPIVQLIKNGRNTYIQLRPYLGGYRRNPYICDTKRGKEFWWNHLMESKIWFVRNTDIQNKFNKTWDIFEKEGR